MADKKPKIEIAKAPPQLAWKAVEALAWKVNGGLRPKFRSDGFPTRQCMEWYSPAELAIDSAKAAVEAMGADQRLTNALRILGDAQDRIADFLEEHGVL